MARKLNDYDSFHEVYNEVRQTGTYLLRKDHIQSHVQPLLTTEKGRGARVLDLGCGSGAFCRHLLDWGADSVLGVDVSRQMLQRAEQEVSQMPDEIRDRITFRVGDAESGSLFPGSPFDLVFGVWIFNYASSGEHLERMFRTAGNNLRPGGQVFALMPPVSQEPKALIKVHMSLDRERESGIAPIDVTDVDDGILVHYEGRMPSGSRFSIHTFHLTQSVVQEAARRAGLMGRLQWIPQSVSHERMLHPQSLSMSVKQLQSYNDYPNHALLIIHK